MISLDPIPAWMADAECAGSDPDLWFPSKGQNVHAARAKAICHTCPVEAECLKHAIDNDEVFGIRGGTSERERRRMRRERGTT